MSQSAAHHTSFTQLKRNAIGRHRPPRTWDEDEVPVCSCSPSLKGGTSCGSNCLNRILNIECGPDTCPCGKECQNMQLQRRQYADIRIQDVGSKGQGLCAVSKIPEGALVAEYLGEVIGLQEAERRAHKYEAAGLCHTYVMNLSGEEVIDATKKGGLARFINHSCEPNCRAEKWLVGGELCVAIMACQDIMAGQELTYDYNLEWNGGKRVRCACGAAKCRGYLGATLRHSLDVQNLAARHHRFAAWQDTDIASQEGELDDYSSDDQELSLAPELHLRNDQAAQHGSSPSTDQAQHRNSESASVATHAHLEPLQTVECTSARPPLQRAAISCTPQHLEPEASDSPSTAYTFSGPCKRAAWPCKAPLSNGLLHAEVVPKHPGAAQRSGTSTAAAPAVCSWSSHARGDSCGWSKEAPKGASSSISIGSWGGAFLSPGPISRQGSAAQQLVSGRVVAGEQSSRRQGNLGQLQHAC